METYLKIGKQTPTEADEDIVIMSDVEVIRDMTDKGPKKGQKYLKVTHMKLSDALIFHLQSGRCRIVQYDGKNTPVWMGEHDLPPVITAD